VTYNEIDAGCCAWLRELAKEGWIPDGQIDNRDIRDVRPEDCGDVCHFFAGIGGWPYALRLAGWPDDRPVWTGSCPCQPFSGAGKELGMRDDRHLWPEWFRIIRAFRPELLFGEQVARAVGHGWIDAVFSDLEGEGYACGATVLGAHSAGAEHVRQRIYWMAYSGSKGLEGIHRSRRGIDLQSTKVNVPRNNWKAFPEVLRAVNGVSRRLDKPPMYREQIQALGNAIVPPLAAEFIGAVMDILEVRQ